MRTGGADSALQSPSEALGLIAGNGSFPILLARAVRRHGRPIVAVAVQGETDQALEQEVDAITWLKVGQLKKMIAAFQHAGVRQAVMAGGIRKSNLLGNVYPDRLGWAVLARCLLKHDDSLLREVAAAFERAGVQIVDAMRYMPEAWAPVGVLTQRKPDPSQWKDMLYGLHFLSALGSWHVGQTVVILEGTVVAMEAMEGTDACIRRAGALLHTAGRRTGQAVMVKSAKPTQDMRFDVPTVGVTTLKTLCSVGLDTLGMQAGQTLLLEPIRLIEEANRRRMVMVGLSPQPWAFPSAASPTGCESGYGVGSSKPDTWGC